MEVIGLEAYGNMKISYNKLWDKLKDENMSLKSFRENIGISGSVTTRLRANGYVTTETIGKICEYFGCQPNDVMEVIFDEDYVEKRKQKEKDKIEAQMAELQKKLENLN